MRRIAPRPPSEPIEFIYVPSTHPDAAHALSVREGAELLLCCKSAGIVHTTTAG